MTALAAAVIPIIRLLVAVATRSGTPIARCISGTLTIPPPMPSSAEATPAPSAPTTPATQVPDAVALAADSRSSDRRARPASSAASRASTVGRLDAPDRVAGPARTIVKAT